MAGALTGAHTSISGGAYKSFDRGQAVGCRTMQIFTKSNMQWRAAALTEQDIARFREAQKATGIAPVVGHNCYLINLASPKEDVSKKSIDCMLVELERAEALGLPYVVMHPGAHLGEGEEWGLKRIAEAISRLLKKTPNFKVKVLLETTAGMKSNLGYKFEQLRAIMDMVEEKSRMGVCYDTCHTFAGGYDIRTKRAYQATMREFDKVIGLENLLAFHFNDAKKELGSRIDRHEHIGKGYIGLDGFRWIMNDRRFARTPKIIETPKGKYKGKEWDVINLRALESLVK